MSQQFQFTFEKLKKQYKEAINQDYEFIRCVDFIENRERNTDKKVIINRIDIDFSVKKAETLGIIFKELGICGSFFIRLHAPEYNPFSFENYRIIKTLIENGNEIGYHSEIVDQAAIWDESLEFNLIRDIDITNKMFNINIQGIASHGGMTGLNNLDFWKHHKTSDFGLKYEAYDWFKDCFYLSDSEWTNWKCYKNGKHMTGDLRNLEEHIKDKHKLIYLLIHSDTYFYKHFYE
jgi:hypothetical protein